MILGTKDRLMRFSFANVFEAKPILNSDPKYSVQVMIPKKDTKTVEQVKAAIKSAIDLGVSKSLFTAGSVKAADFKGCLRDGDAEAEEGDSKAYLKGHYFFNASCSEDNPPAVVDRFAKPIMNQNDFYSGCYGCIDVNFFPFKFGKGGIGAGLNSIMKREDGERLDGRQNVETAFAQVADDEADAQKTLDELV